MTKAHPHRPRPEGAEDRGPAEQAATGWPPRTSPGIDPGEASEVGEASVRDDDELARGEAGEQFIAGRPTRASKGLGAVWGDSEWAPVDEPMSERARRSQSDAAASTTAYELHETESGERYLTDHSADEDDAGR